jgi:predicted nuclease of predicted toxin-antitoxin system
MEIWEYAKRNSFTIVTFDTDFYDFANLYGHPPKIIWLRIGNTSTDHLVDFLKLKSEVIQSFVKNDEYSEIACLEL